MAPVRSEKPSHPVVPKFKISISQACQENYEEEIFDGPLSAKEMTTYTTQPIKSLQGTGSMQFGQFLQTQPSIILQEKTKGKHKNSLSYGASATELKNPVPSTAASSLQLSSACSIANSNLQKGKDSYRQKQVEKIPECSLQTERSQESLILDEFDIDAAHSFTSAKALPKLGGVKKPNSRALSGGLKI